MQKYLEKKILKTYQADRHGFIRPVMLMNELQSIADTHAEILGVGRTFCIANKLAWVVTHYLVEIDEPPRDGEELEFATWPSKHESVKAARDFLIRSADGRVKVRATSQWVMIDLETRKPVRLGDKLPSVWEVLPERALDMPFEKFPDFETEVCAGFQTRYDDVDVNQHVNNAVYASWATESVGFDFRDTHALRRIMINFKKEIPAGTAAVQVCTAFDSSADSSACAQPGQTAMITRHKILTDDIENANVVCEWSGA